MDRRQPDALRFPNMDAASVIITLTVPLPLTSTSLLPEVLLQLLLLLLLNCCKRAVAPVAIDDVRLHQLPGVIACTSSQDHNLLRAPVHPPSSSSFRFI